MYENINAIILNFVHNVHFQQHIHITYLKFSSTCFPDMVTHQAYSSLLSKQYNANPELGYDNIWCHTLFSGQCCAKNTCTDLTDK